MSSDLTVDDAYRNLFLNEAGGLKPSAQLVLYDMFNFALFFSDKAARGDGHSLALTEGARSLVRHIVRKSGAGHELIRKLLCEEENNE